MKNKKDHLEENHDGAEEFILSDSKAKSAIEESDQQDALFEVTDGGKGDACTDETEEKDDSVAEKPFSKASAASAVEDEKDSVFEVSKGATKDDKTDEETKDLTDELGKKEQSEDKKKIEELSDQLKTTNDKYIRLMAEFDNFKRRSSKEYERMVEAASEKVIKDIIEVRENFERAFKSNADDKKFHEGMKLIFTKLNSILHKHGLEIYAEPGQKFDPEFHDALLRTPHDTIAEGDIVEVHEHGYKLKGNIIKHAKVIVSSGKQKQKETEDEAVIEIK